ncbi:MAG: cobalamin-dependent protein [Beijerinckiaceae bacterium]|nr:cobalamin-dependent protein [Beijerinckiaceae bacterium]
MLAHSTGEMRAPNVKAGPRELDAADIKQFSTIICSADLAGARVFVEGLQSRDVPVETILLGLLAPTAKLLGEMWEEDDADFAFVTIALCCLQQVLRDLSGTFNGEAFTGAKLEDGQTYRALLAPAPGEQHIFSVLLVDEFFRRAQWDVWTMPAATEAELVDVLKREHFDMAGLSITCDAWIPQLESLIKRMRSSSLNKNLVIMVGGRPFVDSPELATRIGADATASNGLVAVKTARSAVQETIGTRHDASVGRSVRKA